VGDVGQCRRTANQPDAAGPSGISAKLDAASRFLSSGGNNFSGRALSIDDVPEGISEGLGTIANAIVWLPGVPQPICGVGVVVLTQQLGKVIQTPLLVR